VQAGARQPSPQPKATRSAQARAAHGACAVVTVASVAASGDRWARVPQVRWCEHEEGEGGRQVRLGEAGITEARCRRQGDGGGGGGGGFTM
jgi:hypothetical protein